MYAVTKIIIHSEFVWIRSLGDKIDELRLVYGARSYSCSNTLNTFLKKSNFRCSGILASAVLFVFSTPNYYRGQFFVNAVKMERKANNMQSTI